MKELALVVGIAVSAFLFNLYSGDTPTQIFISLLGCLYYVSWGIIHHALHERINKMIILEYALIGGVAFLLILLVLTN